MKKMNLFESLKKELVAKFDDKVVENIGCSVNLKLYEVSLKLFEQYKDENECANIFTNFCEDSFDDFKEFLDEEDVVMVQLGRTSSFYLDKANHIYGNYNYYSDYDRTIDLNDKKEMLFEEFVYEIMNTDEEEINYYDDDDFELFKDKFNDFLKDLESINNVYNMIDEFKKNQLENFSIWYEQNVLQLDDEEV